MSVTSLQAFEKVLSDIPKIGLRRHSARIVELAEANAADSKRSIRGLPAPEGEKARSGIVISAGPSVHKNRSIHQIVEAGYQGSVIAVDGSYLACLKAGLIPDYVLVLDPHPTRRTRWFGDPDYEKDMENDDYFSRQDLDVEFRRNSIRQNEEHIRMVNEHARKTQMILSTSSARNLVERIQGAGFPIYWWNPLVDDPKSPESVTRKLHQINRLPCLNTGGTVGTAAWVFAHSWLKLGKIGMVGMDFGYYAETPIEQTQTYYELIDHLDSVKALKDCFVEVEFPLTREKFYMDPTYFWYRRNCLELLGKRVRPTFNCTEGGTLFDEGLPCIRLKEFLHA